MAREACGRAADTTVDEALAVLNRALHARRVAAADPYAIEVARRHALVTRIGYGTGEEVSDGLWTAARELPPAQPQPARESALRPQERFAALLAARDVTLAAELLSLRARLDLDHGRDREAALQLEAALAAAVSELEGWRELHGMSARLDELRSLSPGVAQAASEARAGVLDEPGRDAVAHALAASRPPCERARRARRSDAAGCGSRGGSLRGGLGRGRSSGAASADTVVGDARRAVALSSPASPAAPGYGNVIRARSPAPSDVDREQRSGPDRQDAYAPPSSSTTSPLSFTAASASYGVGPCVTSATVPPAASVIWGSCAIGKTSSEEPTQSSTSASAASAEARASAGSGSSSPNRTTSGLSAAPQPQRGTASAAAPSRRRTSSSS